jgi:hypothetical protein
MAARERSDISKGIIQRVPEQAFKYPHRDTTVGRGTPFVAKEVLLWKQSPRCEPRYRRAGGTWWRTVGQLGPSEEEKEKLLSQSFAQQSRLERELCLCCWPWRSVVPPVARWYYQATGVAPVRGVQPRSHRRWEGASWAHPRFPERVRVKKVEMAHLARRRGFWTHAIRAVKTG